MFTHYIYIFYSCITQIILIMLIARIPAYNEAREELKLRLVFLNELKIEVLLFGDDTLTEMQNLQIFKSVQIYIKRTKRFTHFIFQRIYYNVVYCILLLLTHVLL
jgi:hypothetical protein